MKNLVVRIFNHDKIFNGLALGLVIPLALFALLMIFFESTVLIPKDDSQPVVHILRPRTIALLSLCANIAFMQLFNKIRWYQSMRGLTVSTFICILLWLIKYSRDIF